MVVKISHRLISMWFGLSMVNSVRRNFRWRALAELRGTPPERKLSNFRQEMMVPAELAAGDGAPGHSYLTTPVIVSYRDSTMEVVPDFTFDFETVINQMTSCHLVWNTHCNKNKPQRRLAH